MISQNPLKGNYYEAKSRVENLLSLLEKSALNSLEEIDTLMSMLNAKKNDFRIWVTASHNLFLSLYPHLNDSQKTEISTIASTVPTKLLGTPPFFQCILMALRVLEKMQ